MRKLENERIRELENQEMRELGNEVNANNTLINFAKGASRTDKNFGKVCTAKAMCWNYQELSEGNGIVRKWVERDFGEKRL